MRARMVLALWSALAALTLASGCIAGVEQFYECWLTMPEGQQPAQRRYELFKDRPARDKALELDDERAHRALVATACQDLHGAQHPVMPAPEADPARQALARAEYERRLARYTRELIPACQAQLERQPHRCEAKRHIHWTKHLRREGRAH